MRNFRPCLERRQSLRHRPHGECEPFLWVDSDPASRYQEQAEIPGPIVDKSHREAGARGTNRRRAENEPRNVEHRLR